MRNAFIAAAAFAVLSSFSFGSYAASQAQPAPTAPAAAVAQAPVNLNTADAATLTRELKGIGATKAKAIIDYREEHGPFSSVDELLEVKGIGSATLEKLRSQLSVQGLKDGAVRNERPRRGLIGCPGSRPPATPNTLCNGQSKSLKGIDIPRLCTFEIAPFILLPHLYIAFVAFCKSLI